MARIFNSGTWPLVVQWGEGVVMPGESIEVDNPESYGHPWVQDPEAEQALKKRTQQKQDDPPADEAAANQPHQEDSQ